MEPPFAHLLAIVATATLSATVVAQLGCNGCQQPAATLDPPSAGEAVLEEPVRSTIEPSVTPPAKPVVASSPEARYMGPQSRNEAGYKLTSGFADASDKAITQPVALEENTFYVTALNKEDRTIGHLDKVAGADVHAMLVALDMRQALYARADAPVAEGADARGLTFTPREGGDHALIVVFEPKGSAATQTISTPVVIKGALPEVVGPGVASLDRHSGDENGGVRLDTDRPLEVGREVTLSRHWSDGGAHASKSTLPPFAVIYNAGMGFGDVLHFDANGLARWTPTKAGLYLVLAPPAKGVDSLAFKLTVRKPRPVETKQEQR